MRQLTLVMLLACAAPLAAQAPRVGPDGDPSVRNDTIYRLAVDPADYPEESYVLLLDDGILRYDADGRGSQTYRMVVQILTREAAESWGEHTFGYSSSREKLTINWARVLTTDGTVISDKPAHEQESDAPVPEYAPVFTDHRLRRISLGGVEPGTIVDYSFTIETLEPVMPGDFLSGWSVTTGVPTFRSRLILDVPEKLEPRIREWNLDFERKLEKKKGRKIFTWATSDIPTFEPEPFAADSNDVIAGLSIAGQVTWQDVGRWYTELSKDRYALTPAIEEALAGVVADAKTAEDSLRAVHRWVAQDFRYVSLSLGIGGYQPRTPAMVFETKYGDCKDKATLFIALARRLGYKAHPVLVSQGGGVDPSLPSVHQFDHMIAAVESPDGYRFFDLTAELTPFGELPPSLQGEFGLVIHPDGRAEETMLPEDPPSKNRTESRITGELTTDGLFNGTIVERSTGTRQYALRSSFSVQKTEKERADIARAVANTIARGAKGDSLVAFDGRDLTAEPHIAVRISDARITTRSGNTMILTLPLPNYASDDLVADLEARETRRFPIDVGAIIGPHQTEWEFRVTLPEGWTAQLPENVRAESEFGRYEAEYRQEGRELRVFRRVSGWKGIEPPERIGALVDWLKALSADDVPYIVIERPATTAAAR